MGRFTNDSADFARRLLAEAGVAVTPGVDFASLRGAGYVRFSYAGSRERMTEAMDRIGRRLR